VGLEHLGRKCHWQLNLTVSCIGPSCQDSRRCVVSQVNVASIGGLHLGSTPSDCLRLVLRGVMCCPDQETKRCRRLPPETFAAELESLITYDYLTLSEGRQGPH